MTKLVTHATAKGHRPFNWNRFLNQVHYSYGQLDHALKLADDWVTCACGNQCEIIPRNYSTPVDGQLKHLGIVFYKHIETMANCYLNDNYPDMFIARENAKEVLYKIEQRSAILIERELKRMDREAKAMAKREARFANI